MCALALAVFSVRSEEATHDMSTMDPHAHHHHMMAQMNEVKKSTVTVRVTPIPLVRQDASKTTLARELSGNVPTIVAFIYTSCTTVCPVTSQILASTQDALGAEISKVRILSISIDPEYDTPARLKDYAEKYGAKPQWQHFGGTLANSVEVQKAFGAFRGDKMNHVPQFYINGGGKSEWVLLDGFPSAEELVKVLHEQIRG